MSCFAYEYSFESLRTKLIQCICLCPDDPIGELEVWWRRGKGSFTKYSYPYKSYSGGAKGPARVASLARPSTGRAASSGVASTSSPTDISRRNGAVAHVRSGDGLHSAGVAWSRADTKSSRKI